MRLSQSLLICVGTAASPTKTLQPIKSKKLPPKRRLFPHVVNFMTGEVELVKVQSAKSQVLKLLVKNSYDILQVNCVERTMIIKKIIVLPIISYYNLNKTMTSKDLRKKIFPFEATEGSKRRYEFKLGFGSAPHPQKLWKGGEDAFFVSKNIILLADGVGGWAKLGIDSGVYARKLVQIVKTLIQNDRELYYIDRPGELAVKAVQLNEQKGSATLSIITLHPVYGVVRSYLIGDSIYGIFWSQGPYFIADEQQRSFNVPFQVYGGAHNITKDKYEDSDDQQLVSDVFKGSYHQFAAQELQNKKILLASDGLWDNLHLSDIQRQLFSNKCHVTIAKNMIKKAKQVAGLKVYESPFYLKALEQEHTVPKTGKIDDITLIVASVVRSQ